MKKNAVVFMLLLIFFTSCAGGKDKPVITRSSLEIIEADIVFNSIDAEKYEDILGFYTFADQTLRMVDTDWNTIIPYYVAPKTLIIIKKNGYPGDYYDRDGNLMVMQDTRLVRCRAMNTYGQFMKPHGGSVLFSSSSGIFLINPDDCSIVQSVLTDGNGLIDYSKYYNTSLDLSKDGKILVLSNGTNLIRINIATNEIEDYGVDGIYPSISPDQSRIVFLGGGGIFVLGVDGDSLELIVPYRAIKDGYYDNRGNPPKPNWSMDGSKIVYHKCNQPFKGDCLEIENYDIYVYDFETKTEQLIVHGGLNPSWNYFK